MAGVAHIYIEGEIGQGWYDMEDGNTLKSVRAQFKAFDSPESITVHIDSPGGVVDDGFAIHDFLTTQGLPVTTIGEGRVFSIATIILLAGDEGKRMMTENANLMIHNPWGGMYGTADEMEEYAQELRRTEAQLIRVYNTKTGQAEDTLKEWMKKDSYFTATEAVSMGFADGIYQGAAFAMPRKMKAVARLRMPEPKDSNKEVMSTQNEDVKAKGLLSAIAAYLNPKAEVVETPPVVEPAPVVEDEAQKKIDELTARLEKLEAEKATITEEAAASAAQVEASNKLLMQVAAKLQELDETPLASTKSEPVPAKKQTAAPHPFDALAAHFNARKNG